MKPMRNLAIYQNRGSVESQSMMIILVTKTETRCVRCGLPRTQCQVLIAIQVILDPKTSRRIFELARDQQEELAPEDETDDDEGSDTHAAFHKPRVTNNDEDDEDDLELHSDAGSDEEGYPELVRI